MRGESSRTHVSPRRSWARSATVHPPTAPELPLTRRIGPRRAFAWDSIPMADIVAIKNTCDATVNDVVLAIAAGALRRYLDGIGSFDSTGREPRVLIPIGSPESDDSSLHNRFSITSMALPVGVDDPWSGCA
ncbi:MAG: hypothetical protein M5U31_00955 [Acidimicrobiia bacterium]|nr:hypothetical protein [Acidimicrobiia bacterium]